MELDSVPSFWRWSCNVYSRAVNGRYERINMINWGRELLSCTNYVRLQNFLNVSSLFTTHRRENSHINSECLMLPVHCDPATGTQPRITSDCIRMQVSAWMELCCWCRSSSAWRSRGVSHHAQARHYLWLMWSHFRKHIRVFNSMSEGLELYLLLNDLIVA